MAQQITVKEDNVRTSWKVGSVVEVYSSSSKLWYKGDIIKVFSDDEGQWLEIQYAVDNVVRVKQTERDDEETVRPLQTIDKNEKIEDYKEKPKITLNIKTISNQKYAISVDHDCFVADLKTEIQKVSDNKINALLQKLIYKGVQLNDDQRINEPSLQIKDQRTIILVKQSPKRMVITIKTLQSEFHDLQIYSIHTILEIKELIYKQLKIGKPETLNLVYHGKILKDDQTASSAEIKEKDYILVSVKKKK